MNGNNNNNNNNEHAFVIIPPETILLKNNVDEKDQKKNENSIHVLSLNSSVIYNFPEISNRHVFVTHFKTATSSSAKDDLQGCVEYFFDNDDRENVELDILIYYKQPLYTANKSNEMIKVFGCSNCYCSNDLEHENNNNLDVAVQQAKAIFEQVYANVHDDTRESFFDIYNNDDSNDEVESEAAAEDNDDDNEIKFDTVMLKDVLEKYT